MHYNILDYFNFHVTESPSLPCLIEGDTSVSYQDLDRLSDALLNDINKLGLKSEDRIALLAKNSIDLVVAVIASIKSGHVFVPLNYRLSLPEINYILKDSQARSLMVCADFASDELTDLCNQLGVKSYPLDYSSLDAHQLITAAATSVSEDLCQMYTSGTTGQPKGVVSGHRQLFELVVTNALMPPKLNSQQPSLLLMPLFHAVGLGQLFINLVNGKPTVILQDFDPDLALALVDRHQIEDTIVAPIMLQAFVALLSAGSIHNVTSLKRMVYGASSIDSQLLKKAMSVFSADFLQGYGMTELSGGAIFLTAEDHKKAIAGKEHILKSAGRPAPGVRVITVDADKNPLPANESGEIAIYSRTLMNGYWNNQQATSEVVEDGWYYTGDAGYIDEEGYVYICDRIKDMVISGGENIYPLEVERVLNKHPDIVESSVIGIPDKTYGETLLAVCVSKVADTLDEKEVIAFCRDQLAGYKIPRKFSLVTSLPRNAAGKIQKAVLRETHTE
ncbi:AMP-binding protein [Oceanicoccus sagamiensis]|uniref:AMP-dependent synthetase n=1 Tax=Oceanicoccus sagamiensis TaxID=716816 RepID=A0A1X9N7B1_9GAMM|nr:AMP-binding protein [Oceanicoccus sagamiensis]ARN73091.1 hypothetical protein BST96_02590 [Oceanicoccus sagamiensis]